MIEKHIVLEEIDPALIYGVNNANLQMIKALFPKLRIVARGNVIRAMGDDEVLTTFENYIKQLEEHGARYNSLKEEVLLDIFNGNRPAVEREGDVIVFSVTGRPVTPRSENQLRLVKSYKENDMQDLHRHRPCRACTEKQGGEETHPLSPCRGGWRETRLPAW